MEWSRSVAESHTAAVGVPLPADQPALAHDGSADPRITWVNAAAAALWERPPDRFVGIPSRWTALPGDRAARAQALATHEVAVGYSGVRVSATGRRFRIEDATIWPVGTSGAQAATFPTWTALSRTRIEALCTTFNEVTAALSAGADRIELCVSPELGGVTPPVSLTRRAVGAAGEAGVGVMVMIRPRGGDFDYTAAEIDSMRRSIDEAVSAGAAGVVLGCLTSGGRVDEAVTAYLVRRAGGPVTFHRAIDETPDPVDAARAVAQLGCDRILTSGGAATAAQGREMIATMRAAVPITVMAGSGVAPENVAELVADTGVTEVHGSFRAGPRCLVAKVRAHLPDGAD
ncbi:MAG: copper homeostasis protein CutC [Candidatus Nanopelagicales bacterium]